MRLSLIITVILPIALYSACTRSSRTPPGASTALTKVCTGTVYPDGQGGLFLKPEANPAAGEGFVQGLTISMTNLTTSTEHTWNVVPEELTAGKGALEVFPVGRYRINEVAASAKDGAIRRWRPTGKKPARAQFNVMEKCLANLGVWSFMPAPQGKLSVEQKMVPTSFVDASTRGSVEPEALVDAYTGIEPRVADSGDDSVILAKYKVNRQISMFYKLDLINHNAHSKQIADTINKYHQEQRACYSTRLNAMPTLRGDLKLSFELSKKTGTMRKIKRTGGAIEDKTMVDCLTAQLARISFKPKKNMNGRLSYNFDYKSTTTTTSNPTPPPAARL